jgi:predicted membrane-bound dolichyl-phosphate-mannose-protein mannosyltransferase
VLSLSANFLGRERPYVGSDAALFEYSGWYAIHGGVPYLHIWDPKPPVIHEIAAGLAFLSQGNVLVLHFLSSLLMGITAIATVLLISNLTYDVTNNEIAAFVSGLGMLTYPVFYLMPMAGLRPKMFVALFGTLTIYLVRSERFVAGGATAAVTAGLWQFGLFFPLLVGITAMRKSRDRFFESLSGMVSATVLIVFPCVSNDARASFETQ